MERTFQITDRLRSHRNLPLWGLCIAALAILFSVQIRASGWQVEREASRIQDRLRSAAREGALLLDREVIATQRTLEAVVLSAPDLAALEIALPEWLHANGTVPIAALRVVIDPSHQRLWDSALQAFVDDSTTNGPTATASTHEIRGTLQVDPPDPR